MLALTPLEHFISNSLRMCNNKYSPISDHDCSAMGMALIPPASHSLDPTTGGEARPAAQVHWRRRNPSQKQTTTSAKCNAENTTVLARSDGDSPVPIPTTRKARSGWVGKKAARARSGGASPVPLPASALSEEWVGGKRKKCSAMMMHVAAAHMCLLAQGSNET